MYGFPLTIFLLSGWLNSRPPEVNWLAHESGHLPEMLFGWRANPHFGPFHFISMIFIFGGFILLSASWKVLFDAQRRHTPATAGPYSHMRHPQYVAFIIIMVGFLFQWPTVITLAMFPILVYMYMRLAQRQEQDSLAQFGEAYFGYMQRVPAFVPRRTSTNNQRELEA